jgi:sulfatase maturation enzyme AslB (radical SAM superfamily)
MPRCVNGVLQVDELGRLILPPEIAARLGLTPGREAMFSLHGAALHITPPIEHLARVNLEITNACNLDCATCMRNVWDEPIGRMDAALFARVLDGLHSFWPRPLVFFGGYGEPLAHPDVVEMVRQVKALGCTTELITNGILLHPQTAAALLDAGLDTLWASLDGATPEHYSDVRLGSELPRVLENIAHLRQLRDRNSSTRPQIGIAFVAMQSNIADLPEVLRLGAHLGAERFSVSNVLAHTPQLNREVLYRRCLDRNTRPDAHPQVDLPYMDLSPETTAALAGVLDGPYDCLLYTSPSPRDRTRSRMPSSA